eukprot:scaffold15450_cov59-Phaeocystis_antarctica.AAC.2
MTKPFIYITGHSSHTEARPKLGAAIASPSGGDGASVSPTVAEVRAGAACTATAEALGPLGTHCRSESDCRRAEQSAGAACIAGALTAPCAVRQGREAVSRCQQRLLERPLNIDWGSKPCMHDGGG